MADDHAMGFPSDDREDARQIRKMDARARRLEKSYGAAVSKVNDRFRALLVVLSRADRDERRRAGEAAFRSACTQFYRFTPSRETDAKTLHWLAATLRTAIEVFEAHSRIDVVYRELGVVEVASLSDTWRRDWEADWEIQWVRSAERIELSTDSMLVAGASDAVQLVAVLEIMARECDALRLPDAAEPVKGRRAPPLAMLDLVARVQARIEAFLNKRSPFTPLEEAVAAASVQTEDGLFPVVYRGPLSDPRGDGQVGGVVIKRIDVDSSNAERFRRDVDVWREVDCPYVVKLLFASRSGSPDLLILEDAKLGTLREYVKRDGFHCLELFARAREAAIGVQYLHERCQIPHGNLKPSNILVGADGATKVTDFGDGVVAMQNLRVQRDGRVASIKWRAPEFQGFRSCPSLQSDVYSLGLCIVDAVAGNLAVPPAEELVSGGMKVLGMSPEVQTLVDGMTALDPKARTSLTEVISKLDELARSPADRFNDDIGTMMVTRSVFDLVLPELALQLRVFDDMDELVDRSPEFRAATGSAVRRLRWLAYRFRKSQTRAQLVQFAQLWRLARDLWLWLVKQERKTNLLRLATVRRVLEDLEVLNERMDLVAQALDVAARKYEDTALAPSGWRKRLAADREVVLEELKTRSRDSAYLFLGLADDNIFEILAMLKYEFDHAPQREPDSEDPAAMWHQKQRAIAKKAFSEVVRSARVRIPHIPSWFVPAMDITKGQPVGVENCYQGSISPPRRDGGNPDDAPSDRRSQVVIRDIDADASSFEQREFLRAAEIWLQSNHANVVRLRGGSHISSSSASPAFVVYEDAIENSFVDYFVNGDDRHSRRRRRFWRLFLQIATGVEYLHREGIAHGDLRCRNLVVGADGVARVSDFVESESMRRDSWRWSERRMRWKAPECVVADGPDSSLDADVFALGLCLIEAWTCEPPYGMRSDEEIQELLKAGRILEQPYGLPDSVWDVAKRLCAYDPAQRPSICVVVQIFREQAEREAREEEEE